MAVRSGVDVLDNVVWHSLSGPHAHLAEGHGAAVRMQRDVGPFSAVANPNDRSSWDDLADLVGPGKPAIVFVPSLVVPDGWEPMHAIDCFQMVAERVTVEETSDEIAELGPDDVPDMLDLVGATRPGPFEKRTRELGRYVGIRRGGRLVAITGERMRAPGFTEISAVCTAEEVRGQGLARQLVMNAVAAIRARGDEAFLHVETGNTSAIGLYESMGFVTRTEAAAFILRNTRPEPGSA